MSPAASKGSDLLRSVAVAFDVTLEDILGYTRTTSVVRARQAAMWAVRQHTTLSYRRIGRLFGRDHTTVMHAVARIEGARRANPQLRRLLDEVA